MAGKEVGCCGLRGILRCRIPLLLLAFGFLPIHSLVEDDSSSLIEKKCGSLEYEDEDFGTYELTAANCGGEVQLDQVNGREAPAVTFKKAKSGMKYLIAMVDPDAPFVDKPDYRSWLHWIVGNIDGDDLANGDISSGETFTEYNPPSPPHPKPGKTNDHRYFIFVFEQKGILDRDDAAVDERPNFDIDGYKNEHGLKAVAMNMFKTHS